MQMVANNAAAAALAETDRKIAVVSDNLRQMDKRLDGHEERLEFLGGEATKSAKWISHTRRGKERNRNKGEEAKGAEG